MTMNAPAATVHDLRTTFFYDRKSGDGPLRVMMQIS